MLVQFLGRVVSTLKQYPNNTKTKKKKNRRDDTRHGQCNEDSLPT